MLVSPYFVNPFKLKPDDSLIFQRQLKSLQGPTMLRVLRPVSFRRLRWQWWPGVLHPRFERSFWNLRKQERGEGRNFLFSTKVVQHFLLQLVKKLWFTMGRCVGAFIHATPFPDLQHLVKFHFLPLPLAGPLDNEPEGHKGGFRDRATFLKQKKMDRLFGTSVKRDYI